MTDDSPQRTLLSSTTAQAVTSDSVNEAMTLLHIKQPPFPILKLPLELRENIYGYALTSSPLHIRRYDKWLKTTFKPATPRHREQPSLNLLLTNRQIYGEASRVLYHKGCFTIPAFIFCRETELYMPSEQKISRFHPDLPTLGDKWYHSVRNIEMEIGCYGVYPCMKNGWYEKLEYIKQSFARFPHLKTITVSWQSYSSPTEGDNERYAYRTSGDYPIAGWFLVHLMEPLRSFQLSHPAVKITVQVPAESLIFTKLIREQDAEMDLAEFMARYEKSGKKAQRE